MLFKLPSRFVQLMDCSFQLTDTVGSAIVRGSSDEHLEIGELFVDT